MIKKLIFLFFGLYLLSLFQVGFLPHFRFLGIVPNTVFLVVLIVNLLASPHKPWGLLAGFWGGFCLDVFSFGSDYFFGFFALIFLFVSFLIQLVFKQYVRISFSKGP